jgi:hypothetical protein
MRIIHYGGDIGIEDRTRQEGRHDRCAFLGTFWDVQMKQRFSFNGMGRFGRVFFSFLL